ncbi:MAG: hypothetical protein ACOC3V_00060 [bacterium]
MSEETKKIKLNEKVLTEKEFEKEKEKIQKMKNAKLVEIAKDEYRIRLQD